MADAASIRGAILAVPAASVTHCWLWLGAGTVVEQEARRKKKIKNHARSLATGRGSVPVVLATEPDAGTVTSVASHILQHKCSNLNRGTSFKRGVGMLAEAKRCQTTNDIEIDQDQPLATSGGAEESGSSSDRNRQHHTC